MKILLISPYFPPQPAVASLRVHAFARHWTDAGHAVTVVTTAKREDQRGLDLDTSGVEVIEIPFDVPRPLERLRAGYKRNGAGGTDHTAPARRGWLRQQRDARGLMSSVRMPDLTDYWVKPAALWCEQVEDDDWDVMVSSSGPYTAHRVALAVQEVHDIPWVADFRDLWTDNHVHRGLWPFTMREKQLERAVLSRVDAVTTVSEGLAATLRAKTTAPVEVIYNGFDADEVCDATPSDDGVLRIVYTGTLYHETDTGQNPAPLFEALQRIDDDRVRLIVAGGNEATWRRLADEHRVSDQLNLLGTIDREEALRMQQHANALLLLDWHDSDAGVLTTKVFEYLRCAAPILLIGGDAGSPIAAMVTRAGRGVVCGHDVSRILKCLQDLVAGRPIDTGQRDATFIAGLSREAQSQRMLEVLARQVSVATQP